jgi:hypothetical protein
MSTYTVSANMGLTIPIVGMTPGPEYADDLNDSLTIIDQHDHTPGLGVPITPGGININTDLTYNGQNATNLRSARFLTNGSPLAEVTDVGCLYESGVDLYYNDGSGNQIRITQSGGVAGTPGSISGLVAPASATYVPADGAFVWQSAANTAADTDTRDLILRNATANSKGLTLTPPLAMGSDYTITMPALPGTQNIMTLDASGNIVATWNTDNSSLEVSSNSIRVKANGIQGTMLNSNTVDNSTLQYTSNQLSIKALGVGTSQIAAAAVTQAKRAALGQQLSSDCGTFTTTSTSFVDVTNLTITITTTGRPVWLGLISGNPTNSADLFINAAASFLTVNFRNSTSSADIATYSFGTTTVEDKEIPSSSANIITVPAAGTYTYKVQLKSNNGGTVGVRNTKLIAYEL